MKKKVLKILDLLEKEHPDARIALKFSNPLELLVATILAAQCTDERVNQVTRSLFKKYRSAEDYAKADLAILEQDVKPTGFYRKKAQRLKEVCQILIEKFNSEVPRTMEELLSLPGVARKTANIVLSNAYGVNEGIIVDTHVLRLAKQSFANIKIDKLLYAKDNMQLFNQLVENNVRYISRDKQDDFRNEIENLKLKTIKDAKAYFLRRYSQQDINAIYSELIEKGRINNNTKTLSFKREWRTYQKAFQKEFTKIFYSYQQ
ncbi:TPA: endonuclease III [Candidatus Bathyarchaeota archaeon]|nr:endonuclease III [Candidatus Bathyarchaeota archaeon]